MFWKKNWNMCVKKKAEGIIIRSRARWHENGERNSKYFLNLEKRNHVKALANVACEYSREGMRDGCIRRLWQTRTHCCGHIVAQDVSWAAQTGKHLLRHKMFLNKIREIFCPGHKICVRNKCYSPRQMGKHLCRQQCVLNNVSSFARAFKRHIRKLRPSGDNYLNRPFRDLRFGAPTLWKSV